MKKLNNDVYDLLGPAEILYRTKAEEVMLIDKKFQLVLDKILRSMYYYNAIGFGAPQLGIYKRVITIDLGRSDIIKRSDNFYPKFCINPKVIEQSSEYNEDYESTPSLPGIKVLVKRPHSILLSFLVFLLLFSFPGGLESAFNSY